jgi:hypothetical protein
MTPESRASRLESAYTFTARQARFIALVAAMSGYCLRRQYTAFAGIAYGKNSRSFLDDLVARNLATRHQPRRDRAYVYHLRSRPLYAAIDLGDNRHRRPVSTPRQARQLMQLDYAIRLPDACWYATEAEKVALFSQVFDVPSTSFPARIYHGDDSATTTTRQFVWKLPIYRLPDDPAVYFVQLGLDTSGQGTATFLAEHARLLRALPAWHLVVVHPPRFRHAVPAWRAAAARTHFFEGPPRLSGTEAHDLHAYFRVSHALTAGRALPLTIDRAHDQRRRRFAGSPFDALYPFWCAAGGPHLPAERPPDFGAWRPTGAMSTYELPFSYDLYGDFPGVV